MPFSFIESLLIIIGIFLALRIVRYQLATRAITAALEPLVKLVSKDPMSRRGDISDPNASGVWEWQEVSGEECVRFIWDAAKGRVELFLQFTVMPGIPSSKIDAVVTYDEDGHASVRGTVRDWNPIGRGSYYAHPLTPPFAKSILKLIQEVANQWIRNKGART